MNNAAVIARCEDNRRDPEHHRLHNSGGDGNYWLTYSLFEDDTQSDNGLVWIKINVDVTDDGSKIHTVKQFILSGRGFHFGCQPPIDDWIQGVADSFIDDQGDKDWTEFKRPAL